MSGRRPNVRPSRRAVLAACGTGLAALAGCASVDLGGRSDDRSYDEARLDAVVQAGVPEPPDAFPIAVPDAMVDRHTDRARSLLAVVPEDPDLPNGAVAQRLREARGEVVERLESGNGGTTGRDRLAHARRMRADAAEVNGAYRAATRVLDAKTVEERRSALRADALAFAADWDYRGGDPAGALVVHAELEERLRATRRGARAWPPFPADPTTDVFRAGTILGQLETGRAALEDAKRIRGRYLDGVPEPTAYRGVFTVAAHGLDARTDDRFRRYDDFVEVGGSDEELPFDRSLDGTPALELFRAGRSYADAATERGANDRIRAGEYASATLDAARGLASLRAFEAVLDAIESGEYGRPEGAERLATERQAAVAALEAAWRTAPAPVSAAITWPARESIDHAVYRLGQSADPHDVDGALGRLAFARLYAEAVPPVVDAVSAALEPDR